MYLTYTQLYETLKHRASMDYYDHSIAGNGYAYSASSTSTSSNTYGNPGAYAQANPYTNEYSDPYKLPDDNEL